MNEEDKATNISVKLAALGESESDLLSVLNIAADTCNELTGLPLTDEAALERLSTNLLTALQRIRANLVNVIEGVRVEDPSTSISTSIVSNLVEEDRLKSLLDQLDER